MKDKKICGACRNYNPETLKRMTLFMRPMAIRFHCFVWDVFPTWDHDASSCPGFIEWSEE